jgi:hypothetical protein
MAIKQRRISKNDWRKVATFVKTELERRETAEFRRHHEERWTEVDRQLRMEPMMRVGVEGQDIGPGWQSTLELGELSKISEVISADVMRIIFPAERDWFQPTVEIPDVEGPQEPQQTVLDNGYKNLFVHQHKDFGFDQRFELSTKECLHHGAFVAEMDWYEDMMVMDGSKVRKLNGPVWIPHSMWNCFPDDSPRCVSQNMFYQGSMIIRSYMPRYKLEMQKGDGWMPAQFKDVPDDEHSVGREGEQTRTKDVEIIRYWGDIVIDRKTGDDIYLPNSKVILANGTLVYWDTNPLPYPPLIYTGYEKQDPRDPYYTSPLIKLSSWGKIGSVLANEFIDGVRLANQPPIVYDASDPNFAQNGGPQVYPGASYGTQGSAEFKQVQIGDPAAPLSGLELVMRIFQEGTGSDRKTAFEVNKVAQGAEVRAVDFIRKLNFALRTMLYMQHELNRRNLKEYTFYSDDMDTKDFVRISGSDYKEYPTIHFEVTGAKGILGEEQRMMRTTQVTAFASGNPMFAPLLKPVDLLLMMYKDAGIKNPERFVNAEGQEDPKLQEMQQVIQMLQQELQKAQEGTQVEIAKLEQKREESVMKLQQASEAKMMDIEQKEKDRIAQLTMHIQDLQAELQGKFDDAATEMRHQVELIKAQAASQKTEGGPSLNVRTDFDDTEIKGMLDNVMKKVNTKKKRTIKFLDDDTAEVVDEGDVE